MRSAVARVVFVAMVAGLVVAAVLALNEKTRIDRAETLVPATRLTVGERVVVGIYACPMHPEVVSGEPGRCSKCNMLLEKRSGD